ncbi:MFS transporter [Pseudaestuariivita rosea]|uniref:MFS transporter n=1 Tax=Pseudaestuariivita rosea TaxID=2763263 RepID=UPI001ABB7D89
MRFKGIPAFGIMLASIAYVIEITTFPMILESMSQSLGFDDEFARLLIVAYSVALVTSVLVGGWLGDKFSRETVFAGGALLFGASAVAVLFAQSGEQALVFRIVQGIGAGLFSPMVPALLAARKPHDPIAALGFWGMLTGAAAALYPFIGAVLTDNFSWQIGWLMVPMVTIIAFFGLPSSRDVVSYETATPELSEMRQRISAKVWAVMAYVALNYGMTTWFIVSLSLSYGDEGGTFTEIGFILFLLWATFSLGNFIIAKTGKWVNVGFMLNAGVLLNLGGVGIFTLLEPTLLLTSIAAICIGMGMALNNAPTTDLAFRLSDKVQHGRIASLDIIAARIGGAAFVFAIPVASMAGLYIGLAATILSLLLTAYCVRAMRKPVPISVVRTNIRFQADQA